jgi:hypothetical protein
MLSLYSILKVIEEYWVKSDAFIRKNGHHGMEVPVFNPIARYSQVPNKRVNSLNYCNVYLLALVKAKSSTLNS